MARTEHHIKAHLRLIPVKACLYVVPPKAERQRIAKQFGKIRKQFAKFLAENHLEDLRRLGISEAEIDIMRETGRGPEGYTVHHKLPRHGGGTNDFSNLVLISRAIHSDIHYEMDRQLFGSKKPISQMKTGDSCWIDIPTPEGMIYIPPVLPALDNIPDSLRLKLR